MPLNASDPTLPIAEANRVAVAAVAFSIAVYVFGIAILIRRRCCNSKLGCAKWFGCCPRSCTGRVCSRKYSRWLMLLLVLPSALAGVILTSVFFGAYPWTVQYQRAVACDTDSTLIGPCAMSYQVFSVSISAYVFFHVVLLCSWGSCVWMCPFATCFKSTYDAYAYDDLFDLENVRGLNDEHEWYGWKLAEDGKTKKAVVTWADNIEFRNPRDR